jgi:hypothetical protein
VERLNVPVDVVSVLLSVPVLAVVVTVEVGGPYIQQSQRSSSCVKRAPQSMNME